MDNFKNPLYKENLEITDTYLQDIEQRLRVKQNVGIINTKFDDQHHENLKSQDHKKIMAINRAKVVLSYWGAFFLLLTNSFAIYPISVKIVRKMFKLTGFWNIHFGIIPIMLNWNAAVFGFSEGLYHYYNMKPFVVKNVLNNQYISI